MIIIKKLLLLGALGASVLGVNAQKAKAATVNQNVNATTVKRTVNSNGGVSVFANYENAGYTGELLRTGDEVNVYDTKTDLAGNKWIKIGQDEWIMEQYTAPSGSTGQSSSAPSSSTSQSGSAQYKSGSTSQSNSALSSSTGQSSSGQYGSGSTGQSGLTQYGSGSTGQSSSAQYGSGSTGQSSSAQYGSGSTGQSGSAQYESSSTSQSGSAVVSQHSRRSAQTQNFPAANNSRSQSENSAKEWIAQRESGGSYTAQNGQYYGRYQLSHSYLNGDYSIANQEKTANNYVKSRYGSWSNAKNFWQTHGWY